MSDVQPAAAAPAALWFLNSRVEVAVSNASNPDGLSVLRHHMPFGDAPPLHVHHDEDEIFHILDGEIQLRIGDAETIARTGDTVLAPRGVPHGFRVVSPEGVRCLTISNGGFETMVRAISHPAEGDHLPEQAEPTLEMQAELGRLCAAQRIELLGPPLV